MDIRSDCSACSSSALDEATSLLCSRCLARRVLVVAQSPSLGSLSSWFDNSGTMLFQDVAFCRISSGAPVSSFHLLLAPETGARR